MDVQLQKKFQRLKEVIRRQKRRAVAYSGGVDSTLVLKVAADLHKDNVTGFLARSVFQIPADREQALQVAHDFGIRVVIIDFDLLSDAAFCANHKDRCYTCKKKIFSKFLHVMPAFGCHSLFDGTNNDDTQEDRPGHRALRELQVISPLQEVGLTKKEIRRISRELGLVTWNKPSGSCLATRIAHGQTLTLKDKEIVFDLEEILHSDGFYGCRVKIEKKRATVCLAAGDHQRFMSNGMWGKFKKKCKSKGFNQVFLDLSERAGILT